MGWRAICGLGPWVVGGALAEELGPWVVGGAPAEEAGPWTVGA